MINRKGRIIMALLLGLLSLLNFGGCKNESPTTGNTIDKTDYDAPKVIESKDITAFRFSCVLFGEAYPDGIKEIDLRIARDSGGVLTVYEDKSGISFPADDDILKNLQSVIDKYELAKNNGVYKYVSGLAPGYQPYEFTADYASGEKLTFTENNDPYAQWEIAVCDVFTEWFAANGIVMTATDTDNS